MSVLPAWLAGLLLMQEDSNADRICRIVRGVVGLSLDNEPNRLADLFLVTEPSRQSAVSASTLATNCGTTMRAIYALCGCDHPLVTCPIRIGMALSWVLTAAREKNALVPASSWRNAGPGWGLHYATSGRNDDHVEWLMERPNANGVALHAGGGKPRNAITWAGPNDIRWSTGRPLVALIDPDKMLAPSPPFDLRTTRGVQDALNALGYGPLAVDGIAGPKTTAAVRAFQHDHRLTVDGVVGPVTRGALEATLLLEATAE